MPKPAGPPEMRALPVFLFCAILDAKRTEGSTVKTEVRGLRFACGREVRDVPALRESFFELAREVFRWVLRPGTGAAIGGRNTGPMFYAAGSGLFPAWPSTTSAPA